MTFKIQQLLRFTCVLFTGVQFACACVYAEVPTFINDSIYVSNKANVVTIDFNPDADLVILDGGLEQGLQLGMTCLVERDTSISVNCSSLNPKVIAQQRSFLI